MGQRGAIGSPSRCSTGATNQAGGRQGVWVEAMSRAWRLDDAMERAGTTMSALSSRCRVSKSALYRFAAGRDIRISVLERIAAALDVSPAWLVWGIDAKRLTPGALLVTGDVLDERTRQWVEDVRRECPGVVVVFGPEQRCG